MLYGGFFTPEEIKPMEGGSFIDEYFGFLDRACMKLVDEYNGFSFGRKNRIKRGLEPKFLIYYKAYKVWLENKERKGMELI